MKTRVGSFVVLIVCSVFAMTVVFGQTTYTWTGAANGTNYYTADNWSPVGYPLGCIGDTARWDGVTTTNLVISHNPTSPLCEFAFSGLNFVLTANQTNLVRIVSPVVQSGTLSLFAITNHSDSAPLILGDETANRLSIVVRPSGDIHYWVNNSAAAVTVNPSIRLLAGGGAAFTVAFCGTGDWIINHYLRNDNNSGPTTIQKDGPGTLTWTAAGLIGISPIGPVSINDGTLVLKSSGLLANQSITNNATLQYDAAAQSQILGGVISGTGQLKVDNGTLVLTGTNPYSGSTTVNAGKLVFSGAKTGNGSIALAAGATLGITTTGAQITPAALTLGTSSGGTLEFNNVTNTTAAPLSPTTLSSAGVTTIRINSGNFTVGQSYPLLTWMSGSPPAVNLSAVSGFSGNLSFSGNTLLLNVTSLNAPTLNFTRAGNNLQFSWNNGFGRFKLQVQINNLSVGLGNSWSEYPGGHGSPVTVPIDDTKGTVFFRLSSSP